VLLHLCQPTEEELGRTRLNEGMTYLGKVFFFPLSLSLSRRSKT